MPKVTFISQRTPNDAVNVNAPTASEAEDLHAELVEAAAVEAARRSRSRGSSACEGRARKPSASVPHTPAMPCAAIAPIGSSIRTRSTRRTPRTTITPATNPITIAAPRRDERARRGDRDESGDRAVQHHREVGLLDHEPRREHRAEHAGCRGEVRVQRDVGEEADAAEVDAERRARVEAEPAEPEDDHAERRERHVVPGDRVRLSRPRRTCRYADRAGCAPASPASAPW